LSILIPSETILTGESVWPWYALQVRPRYEKQVSQALHRKGFEDFLPLQSLRRRWSDRWKEVEFPLFPGYLFCRLDDRNRMPVLTVPGVIRIVGSGTDLTPVPEKEIQDLQIVVHSGLTLEPWPYLKKGQRVMIVVGNLTGVEGILLKKKGMNRLVVSVDLLQRSVALEIDAEWVKPL
jgi:transcription antitermination factor NusG